MGRFRLDDVPDRYQVRTGDIVFRSRGDRNTALTLGSDFDEPAIAVMPLVIIRPHPRVLPHYLTWYINEPPAQHHFEKGARGTGIRMIPMSCLSKLEVPIPDLETQRAIAVVNGLVRREFQLATNLAEKRRQLISAALLRGAHEST
ncbi:MAG: restriction endonuclease subunit S [Alphaproteobacteria bacterium]|nr:restriction endonuclease subunit S [Alphaproteobacteria bacterium]